MINVTAQGNPQHVIAQVDFAAFKPTDMAFPTSRLLDGSSDSWADQEWYEPGVVEIDDKAEKVMAVYLFEESQLVDDDGEPLEAYMYPWSPENVARFVLAE